MHTSRFMDLYRLNFGWEDRHQVCPNLTQLWTFLWAWWGCGLPVHWYSIESGIGKERYSENQPRPSGKMNLLPPDACSAIHCKVFFVQLHGWLWRTWSYTWACWDCASTRYSAAACGHVISMQSPLKVFLLFSTDCYHRQLQYEIQNDEDLRRLQLLGEGSLTKGNKPHNRL